MPTAKGTRPPRAGRGRPKGSKNKITRSLREMILGALDDAGGQEYLAAQARENPGSFLALLGKILPRELSGPDGEMIPVSMIHDGAREFEERLTKL